MVLFRLKRPWFCDWVQTEDVLILDWLSSPTGLGSVVALKCIDIMPIWVWFCVAFNHISLYLCVYIRHRLPCFCYCLQTQYLFLFGCLQTQYVFLCG